MGLLILTFIFLAAAVTLGPLFQKLGLGTVLGFLVAGLMLGPSGLEIIWDTEEVFHFSELGIVFLMFIIGLELQPDRLRSFRPRILRFGLPQVFFTSSVFFLLLKFGLGWTNLMAILVGFSLSISCTAFVLQHLISKGEFSSERGQRSFAVLLTQDLCSIPVLALLPVLVQGEEQFSLANFFVNALILFVSVIILKFVLGRYLKTMASSQDRDIFLAAVLALILGVSMMAQGLGFSMALGSFIAGLLLAESQYRIELETLVAPFKGLLLGLFFMALGMSADLSLFQQEPMKIVLMVLVLISTKYFALRVIQFSGRQIGSDKHSTSIYLAQGGEFTFVILGFVITNSLAPQVEAQQILLAAVLSILVSPVLLFVSAKWILFTAKEPNTNREFDAITDHADVMIAGFGRFGQIVGRLLTTQKRKFTAIDKNVQHVDFVRKFGNKIFYGDATNLDLLHSCRIQDCKLFVLAIDDVEESLRVAALVRSHFPAVQIFARARNRAHAYRLLDLQVQCIQRETFHSSVEMGKSVLSYLGLTDQEVQNVSDRFREFDEKNLLRQHEFYLDEAKLVESGRQALLDLERLFDSDSKEFKT